MLGGLEAWRPGCLEAWRLGGLEAWRLESLEAWRLRGLDCSLDFVFLIILESGREDRRKKACSLSPLQAKERTGLLTFSPVMRRKGWRLACFVAPAAFSPPAALSALSALAA